MENSKINKLIRFNKDLTITNISILITILLILGVAIFALINGRIGPFSITIFLWSAAIIIYQYWRWKFHNPILSNYIEKSDKKKIKELILLDLSRTGIIVALTLNSFLLSTSHSPMSFYQFMLGICFITVGWWFLMGFFYLLS